MQTFSIMAAPAPQLLRDYLIYMSTIKGRSPRTVEAYYNDLRLFLRYLMATRSGTPLPTDDPNLESISFASISEEMILSARLSDAYSFLMCKASTKITPRPVPARFPACAASINICKVRLAA